MNGWILVMVLVSAAYSEVRFVAELFRHGARYPLSDIFDGNETKQYHGQLTSVGLRQQYLLGSYFKRDYVGETVSAVFDARQVEVVTDGSERCQLSAAAHMQGMFPLAQGPLIPQGVDQQYLLPPFASTPPSDIAQDYLQTPFIPQGLDQQQILPPFASTSPSDIFQQYPRKIFTTLTAHLTVHQPSNAFLTDRLIQTLSLFQQQREEIKRMQFAFKRQKEEIKEMQFAFRRQKEEIKEMQFAFRRQKEEIKGISAGCALEGCYQAVAIKQDKEIFASCPNDKSILARRAEAIAEQTALFQVEQAAFTQKMRLIFNLSVASANIGGLVQLYDVLVCDIYLGRSLPAAFSDQDLAQLHYIQSYLFVSLYSGEAANIYATPFLTAILRNMDAAINGTSARRLLIMSGHDTNVVPVAVFLNITNAACLKRNSTQNCASVIPFAGNLIIQLQYNQQYEVKIKYNGQYFKTCNATSFLCPYQQFAARIRRNMVDFKKECGVK